MKIMQNRAGFTLAELLVAVVILSTGLVLIMRSFLSVVVAIDYAQGKIEAVRFLDTKACRFLEEMLVKKNSMDFLDFGEIILRGKKYTWQAEMTPSLFESSSNDDALSSDTLKRIDLSISRPSSKRLLKEEMACVVRYAQ